MCKTLQDTPVCAVFFCFFVHITLALAFVRVTYRRNPTPVSVVLSFTFRVCGLGLSPLCVGFAAGASLSVRFLIT